MHILQITPQLPWPPDNGGRMALHQLVRQIGRRNRLTLLSLCDGDAAAGVQALAPHCESIITVRDQTGSLFSWLDAATSERPFSMARFHSRALAKKAADICEQRGIDLVHFDHLHTAAYVRAIPPHLPTLLREHNVESRILERFAETATGPLLRPLLRRQARALARYEGISCARFDRCLAVTKVDAQRLRALAPTAHIEALPDGVDTDFFRPQPAASVDPDRLVTTGDYSWRPTRDGLDFLTEEIFPRLRSLVPHARLSVVGRGAPNALLQNGAARGIDVLGRVPDVRPEIARGAVFVSPTRVGSGIRIKILEAMALARPVVATTIGAEGIEAADGEHLRLGDNPQALAETIAGLLADAAECERLGRAGRRLVERKYGWDGIGDSLCGIYEELAGRAEPAV
jgi:glycosyltransferase involved in cell wall biosynthesis